MVSCLEAWNLVAIGFLCPTELGCNLQKTNERWQELCAKAAVEQDSDKLMELIDEINRVLSEKEPLVHRRESGIAAGANGASA
jgi:molecular chaperone GrpE (heat shock protein)